MGAAECDDADPRDHHALAYDKGRGSMVMFGGRAASSVVRGTWTWDGVTWVMADSATGPEPLAHHAMSYDARRQRIVLYGGIGDDGRRSSDTWEWDATGWERGT
jgi:hypothetical protein